MKAAVKVASAARSCRQVVSSAIPPEPRLFGKTALSSFVEGADDRSQNVIPHFLGRLGSRQPLEFALALLQPAGGIGLQEDAEPCGRHRPVALGRRKFHNLSLCESPEGHSTSAAYKPDTTELFEPTARRTPSASNHCPGRTKFSTTAITVPMTIPSAARMRTDWRKDFKKCCRSEINSGGSAPAKRRTKGGRVGSVDYQREC